MDRANSKTHLTAPKKHTEHALRNFNLG